MMLKAKNNLNHVMLLVSFNTPSNFQKIFSDVFCFLGVQKETSDMEMS